MSKKEQKLIAIVSNEPSWTYNLRKEIIEALLQNGYRVALVVGYGEKIKPLIEKGCEHYDVPVERHGMNPVHELKLLNQYRKIIKKIKPDVVLTFTLKPNSYAGLVCRKERIPYIANVTGLGNPIKNGGIVKDISLFLLRCGVKKAHAVFLQNTENQEYLLSQNVLPLNNQVLPGSGVNTEYFSYVPYPKEDTIDFVFVSRVMKQKGIDEYLNAAKCIREKYPETRFHICGFCEDDYEDQIRTLSNSGIVNYHGMVDDIGQIYKNTHCVVLPSYHEGMANALLEAAATGRPVIASRIHGCVEAFDEAVTGFGCEVANAESLVQAIEKFLALTQKERETMGIESRKKIEKEFDRNIVVSAYLREIDKALTGGIRS